MRVALLNPNWSYAGSIYFGCRAPHLPLELGWCEMHLTADGHAVRLLDAHLFDLSPSDVRAELVSFRPELTVITTAPTYLFWRCPPPELRVPIELAQCVADVAGRLLAVGPHGSTTPAPVLRKLPVHGVVMGECEDAVRAIAAGGWGEVAGLATLQGDSLVTRGGQQTAAFVDAPPLVWPDAFVQRHRHHHHRFDAEPCGPGAEVEASRGCPYHCTFCAKESHRDRYRRRPVEPVLAEIETLLRQGVEYVYFIDEIFLPNRPLLEALVGKGLKFGIQTRIDLWKPDMLALLGAAGCVSIEAGVESLTRSGRDRLDKNCKLETEVLADRLVAAKRHVPFVQANLLKMSEDEQDLVDHWRQRLQAAGVWANDPVPLFPYPGSPDYRRLWGLPDDAAWERAVDFYLETYASMSDLQEARPRRVLELEAEACRCAAA